jgi:hypothetical protein
VIFGPVDSQGAAVGENHDQRLAGGGYCFKQILLGFGQVEAGAVASLEAGLVTGHLLAFQLTGNAYHGHHHIGIFGRLNSLRIERLVELLP